MGTTANTVKKSGNFVKNVGAKEIKFRNRTALGIAIAASLIAANGDAREGGANFGHGVAKIAPYVGSAVVGSVEFIGGLFGVDGDSVPESVNLPNINLPTVGSSSESSAQESTVQASVAISPGGAACTDVLKVIVAASGDSPISLATDAGLANAGSYDVAANSAHIPYPGDSVAVCS